jgi:hypothetical protein
MREGIEPRLKKERKLQKAREEKLWGLVNWKSFRELPGL